MPKVLIVATREYLKVVRKLSFWLTTLFFPVFIAVIMVISGVSAQQSEARIKELIENAKGVFVLDESGIINENLIVPPYVLTSDYDSSLIKVKNNEADALIVIPESFTKDKKIELFVKDEGILSAERFNAVAESLVKVSILSLVDDPTKIEIYNSAFNYKVVSYKDGIEVSTGIEAMIVPGIAAIIYFVLTSFAASYMLLSVSEEKENRVIETVLTTIRSRDLILGKILGQMGIVVSQLFVLVGLSIGAILIINPNIVASLNLGMIVVTPVQVLLAIMYTFLGFLFLSTIMVGVGASMPTYKEASSLSSVFIILSILPVYFAGIVIADPNGPLSILFSYFPFTSALLLLFRSSLGVMGSVEILMSFLILAFYIFIAMWLALKLFEFGSLEYSNKISLKGFLGSLRKNKS